MNILDEIAIKYGTDKSSHNHNYCNKYEKYFKFDRNSSIKMLEIGVLDGASVNIWSEFYPNASIVAIDIDPRCKNYESKKITIEIGSQDNEDFINDVCTKYGPFDLILDDGSHQQSHMIKSFEYSFKFLKSGGIYVIEDVCCSYWDAFGGGYKKEGTSVEYFKNLVDEVNFNGLRNDTPSRSFARREDWLVELVNQKNINIRTDIESINFLNSIIIITKR